MSKRIVESSKKRSDLFGVVPYVDPNKFNNQLSYTLNKKSDVYSFGMLMWEISSGQPPFCAKGELYDGILAGRILQGHRETIVPSTPVDYAKLYTGKCYSSSNFSLH